MSSSYSPSSLAETDITFTELRTVLFDSPCSWTDADSDSSDSGLGSPSSLSEVIRQLLSNCKSKIIMNFIVVLLSFSQNKNY